MAEMRRRAGYRVFLLRIWDEPREPPTAPAVADGEREKVRASVPIIMAGR